MDKLVNNMQEYVESVFNLKKNGENSYFPVENPLTNLLDDEILYRHYQKGDTSAIATRVEEALSLFSQELHNQVTANWIYDIRSELTIPPDNEE